MNVKKALQVLRNGHTTLKTAYLMRTAPINPAPVIVLGHSKTGTTAIAMLLGQATGKVVQSDICWRIKGQKNFREKLYRQEVTLHQFIDNNRLYFQADIIKEPTLSFFYNDLSFVFDKSRFIFINRDPRDNIRSILNRLKIPGNLALLDDCQTSKLSPGWKFMLKSNLPFGLVSHYIDKLAHWYNLAADTYIKHGDNMVLIRYEDFVKDKVGEIGNLARAVEFEPIHDIQNQVDIQYQPRGNRDVSWVEFFGIENLNRIETICGERMKEFGYNLSSQLN
ncbi:MAG: sulfotransferase domain-containing protein [Coleofasciculus chthonoplastes F3-SA18-01]|jgi:hypothetical protein|uniref:sulfotransferase domain-containing protein n=1 Tax=Coleofasciculus chthonoplastes TaxID=64178 RepID=UPI0032F9BB49